MQFLIDFLCKDGNSECRVWMLATVFITAVVVYLNSLTMGFVWDDINLILQPGPLRSLENIPYFFKNSVAAGLKFGNHTPYYRPVFSLSLALDYFFWGIAPFGYHLTNILMHAAVSCLVFLISARIFSSTPAALAAALVYALHPVHAEAVAYVGARNELLCGLFVAASFLLYLKYRTGLNLYNLLLVQILFFAALLSKEMAATLPLIVVFYEISIGDSSFKKAVIRSIPFFALLGLYLLLRSAILDVTTWESPPLPVRSYTGVGIVASYLELLIFPSN